MPENKNAAVRTTVNLGERQNGNLQQGPLVEVPTDSNVLNNYRSVNYIFTLACLRLTTAHNPKVYRESELNNVILRSGGKGEFGIDGNIVSAATVSSGKVKYQTSASAEHDAISSKLVEGFNKNSPGRFDFFIDNLQIDSYIAFTPISGATQPTKFSFEVVEPYSINGFLEALQVSAIAGGYPDYRSADFVLKVEFIGYPDNKDITDPEQIPFSVRYFTIRITGMEVTVSERGTIYKIDAIPTNETIFGQPNKLKKSINMSGKTVREILENFINNLNAQVSQSDKDSKENTRVSNQHDTYKIKFQNYDDKKGFYGDTNKIADSKVEELLKSNTLYKFEDPGTTNHSNAQKADGVATPSPNSQASTPEAIKYNPNGAQVQFSDGGMIHEVIASVIRDSSYVRDLIEHVKTNIDTQTGLLDYFLVRTEIKNIGTIDDVEKKPFYEYTYIVTPYKVHYTTIPGFASLGIDFKKLKVQSLREYNYVYTGKNTEVLNFKLNFNYLYFDAMPPNNAKTDQLANKNSAGNSNNVNIKQKSSDMTMHAENQDSFARVMPDTGSVKVQREGGNANQPQDDPYGAMAKNMHQAIINSKAALIDGELEILGDPFFLVTGGIGNYNPKPASPGKTTDGESNHMYGSCLITVNFANPIDYNTTDNGGLMYFSPNKIPFGGLYRVIKVENKFREGKFTQTLQIVRVPGQISSDKSSVIAVDSIYKDIPNPSNQVVADTTRGSNAGSRPSQNNLLLQLLRGLPSPGLPGALSNFTNAVGGLGGVPNSSQASGAISSNNGSGINYGVYGSIPNGTDQLSSGVRLNTDGYMSNVYKTFGTVAETVQLGNTFGNNLPSSPLVDSVAAQINASGYNASSVGIQGSGIGVGATRTVTADQVASTNASNRSAVSLSVNSGDLATAVALGTAVSGLVGGAGQKVFSIVNQGSAAIAASAATYGIIASQVSGLSSILKSKLSDQLQTNANTVPSDVNLVAATNQGLVVDYIKKDDLKNIPPTDPYSTAPAPKVDPVFISRILAQGGTAALENLYNVGNIGSISSNILPGSDLQNVINLLPSGLNKYLSFNQQLNVFDLVGRGGPLMAAQQKLNQLVGTAGSLESQFTQLNNSIGNTLNNPTPLNLAKSVTTQFGTTRLETSPLQKLLGL